jgi:hypothetical protein
LKNDNAKDQAEPKKNKADTLTKNDEKKEQKSVDYQLMRALDLINGVYLFTVKTEVKER